jgi:AraC family transcriptional regulator of arabinose operon
MRSADLTFLHANEDRACTSVVDKHFAGYYTLQFMQEGTLALSYDDRKHTLAGRWFWPAYPGPLIRFTRAAGCDAWHHRYAAFTGPLVTRWIADGLFPDGPQPAPQTLDAPAEFDALLAAIRSGGRWGTLRAINQLERILIALAEDRAPTASAEPWLEGVIEQLAQPAFDHDYAALADGAGMALSTLRRRFRKATGAALHHYALQCRIAEARRRLGESDDPIKRISDQLGYSDVFFFTKQFRKLTGLTPAAFRRSRQG